MGGCSAEQRWRSRWVGGVPSRAEAGAEAATQGTGAVKEEDAELIETGH